MRLENKSGGRFGNNFDDFIENDFVINIKNQKCKKYVQRWFKDIRVFKLQNMWAISSE